jgi:hypothetical protein
MRLPRRQACACLVACGIALTADPAASQGLTLSDRLEPSLEAQLKWALGTGRGLSQKAELVLLPEVEAELQENLSLTAIGRLRADAFDQLMPGQPSVRTYSHLSRPAQAGSRIDIELRELYAETSIRDAYLTLGKQQIVWGKSDGLKVLDVVNPRDFREFILEDFEDSRIPLWAFNAEIPIRDVVLQLIWLPDQTYDAFPPQDGLYAFTIGRFGLNAPQGVQVDLRPLDRPSRIFTDSDAGVRLSTFWRGWDLTLNYLYHYHDIPIPFQKRSTTAAGPLVTITPSYRRTHLFGSTFSNAFGDLTVRSELAYSTDRYYPTENPAEADGVVETPELKYVLGLDWYGFSETLLSFQLFQSWLTRNESGLLRDDPETVFTVLARREFLNDQLVLEVIWLQDFHHADGLVRPRATYELSDTLRCRFGLDLFYGSRNGVFGEFDENDRISLSLEWSI